MDDFILWNVSYNDKTNQLSFFATNTQIQRINKGTPEMISEMLNDLDISEASFEQWRIERFITDYLMDFPPSDVWEEIWAETWEIELQLLKPIQSKALTTELVRTFASDATWKAKSLDFFPIKCAVVADFYDCESLTKAKTVLEKVKHLRESASTIDEISSQSPNISKRILMHIHEALLELDKSPEQKSSSLSIFQRVSNPLQLIIDIGIFGEKFFLDDTLLACWISDLIHELGGTTSWEEKTDIQVFGNEKI